MKDESELLPTEHHMAADHAMTWFKEWQLQNLQKYGMLREAVASTALSGNRLAQILHGTLERLATGQPVSDRYLLGLCWYIKEIYLPGTKEKSN